MNQGFKQLLAELRRGGFAELAGSRAGADLTIPESIVNRAAAALLADAPGRVRELEIRVEPGDRFHMKLRLAHSFVPSIGIEATIERQPELPHSPAMVLKWRSLLPGLASLAGMAASFFRMLPSGVQLEGDRILLDLRSLLAQAGAADLLPLLSEVRISTRAGAIDLHVVVGPVR
jgi:hypothetical protein